VKVSSHLYPAIHQSIQASNICLLIGRRRYFHPQDQDNENTVSRQYSFSTL